MFFGRDNELESLSRLWKKRVASFVTCRGRRRIGKSRLIEEFAAKSNCRFIEIAGLAPRPKMANADQLANFAAQLAAQSELPASIAPSSWAEAFAYLSSAIRDGGRTVVLLDEVSWMGKYDPDFAGMLKNAWDMQLKKHDRLVLVVCGSVSTWINKNILESSSFAGRISLNLTLDELPLSECVRFWGGKATRLDVREILDVLSVTGGVPKYLEEIDPSASSDENIRRLCFLPEGALVEEFNQIFSEIFEDSAAAKKEILRSLANGPLTGCEIAEKISTDRNGHLSRHLAELESAGFIACDDGLNPATGRPAKIAHYRIRDNYTRFYLHHMEPRMEAIRAGSFEFETLDRLAGWQTILGLQFEALVVNHYRELLPWLNPGRSLILSACPYRKRGKEPETGVQIDLLIQMRNAFEIVEVKRAKRIDEAVEAEVERKIGFLPIRGRKTIRTALVYDGELSPTVRENGYFDVLLSAQEWLLGHFR
jgi:AAA+ ATPase superfamily predicted ATPase